MNILICGASGFVGRHLTRSLRDGGHRVVRAVRSPAGADDIAVDFLKDTNKSVWLPRLAGFDTVINAVGVLRDSPATPMRVLHTETPRALFAAAAEAGVARIVHISALGVDSGIDTDYFNTRRQAEQALATLPDSIRWLCLRPSVIYGEDGASAKMFRMQASLPLHVLLMGGRSRLQPVHIADICLAVANWLADPEAESGIVAAAGAEETDMRGMLDSYRQQLGYGPVLHLSLPDALAQLAARMGDFIPSSPLCSDTLVMLAAGNTANPADFKRLLGKPPRSFREFIRQ